MRHLAMTTALALAAAAPAACGPPRIRPYTPKVRDYKPERYAARPHHRDDGSLWREDADTLFTNRRSSRVGDLVTIIIKESATARRDADTNTSRSSKTSIGVSGFFGLMKALKAAHPDIDPKALISALASNSFTGKGQTKRSGSLTARLTARIKRVLPNGDLYVEGSKVVMVNDEESHLYLSGVVRPSDLAADNTVASGVLADLQVEYTGRGSVSDTTQPGWFQRFISWIWPF